MKIMTTLAEFQKHFIESFGSDWEFMSREKRARIWDSDMKHRKKNGFPVFPNPWEDAPAPSLSEILFRVFKCRICGKPIYKPTVMSVCMTCYVMTDGIISHDVPM